MARFNRESELDYTFPVQRIDDPAWWAKENAYYGSYDQTADGAQLGEDAGESVVMASGQEVSTVPGVSVRAVAPASSEPWYASLAKALVPAAANVYQSAQLNKLNIARAQQGLAPISGAQFAQLQPPTATVQVGPSAQAQQWMKYGAIGVGALVLLKVLKVF